MPLSVFCVYRRFVSGEGTWTVLKGILQSDHPLIVQNTPELCISSAGIDGPYGKKLDVFPYKVLHNRYELPGTIVYVLGPSESKVEYIPNIIVVVLKHNIISS
jgi:hypothetical protein